MTQTESPPTRELLYCWVANVFAVLVPKKRGAGFLRVPYGHHHNAKLTAIGDAARCDICGLDGALEFECGGRIFHGGETLRKEFSAVVVPLLEGYYGVPAREIRETEYWTLNPCSL